MVLVGLFGVSEVGHMTTEAALEQSLEEGVQGSCLNHRHYNLRPLTYHAISEKATKLREAKGEWQALNLVQPPFTLHKCQPRGQRGGLTLSISRSSMPLRSSSPSPEVSSREKNPISITQAALADTAHHGDAWDSGTKGWGKGAARTSFERMSP